ncbi:MAG: VTT domain-containing protein, partial [Bacillota bacterium]
WDWLHVRLKRWFKYDLREVTPFLGFWGIVVARIFPVVPTPLINFVGGISGISAGIFISASAIGKVPTAFIYTGLGSHMMTSEDIYSTLALLAVVCALSYAGMRVVQKRFRRQ